MAAQRGKRTMLLLTDVHGRILAVAGADESTDATFSTGIKPLPGQALHEVEVPKEVSTLQTANDAYQWTRRHYVRAGEKPQVRPIAELLKSVPYFERVRGVSAPSPKRQTQAARPHATTLGGYGP